MAKKGKYWLFFGENYYPSGGFDDFVAASDDIDELRKIVETGSEGCLEDDFDPRCQWWHIVDTEIAAVVDEHSSAAPDDEMRKRMDKMDAVDKANQPEPTGPRTGTGGDSKHALSPVYDEKE